VFDDELLVGVYAGANDGGSLLETMGLARVTAHFEGTSVDIAAPGLQTFPDANGELRTYFGWWIRLKRDGRDGFANLYFEAVPRDPAMQSRVIGPYVFLPRPREEFYDFDLTVAPSQPEIAGSRYRSLYGAGQFLFQKTFSNARVRVVEQGTYTLGTTYGTQLGTGKGRVTIEATEPIVIANAPWPNAATTSDLVKATMAWNIEPICLRGSNITIDMSWAYVFNLGATNLNWFDGVRFTIAEGPHALFYKQLRMSAARAIFMANWLTECHFSNIPSAAVGQSLVRGCTFVDCYSDMVDNCDLVIGCRVERTDNQWFRTPIDAMTVRYDGPGSTATIEGAGGYSNMRTFTFKVDGAVVGSYALKYALATYDTDANYEVRHLVDYVNAVLGGSGWSATLLDNSRLGSVLSHASQFTPASPFPPIDAMGKTVTLRTAFDVHADFAQTYGKENFIVADCTVVGADAQIIFFKDGPVKDALVINNAFGTVPAVEMSQFADAHSHVVVAHNAWSQQGFWFRTDLTGGTPNARYNPDQRCLFGRNVGPSLSWIGAADADLAIAGNHLFAGAAVPAGADGTTTGGTAATLFADAAGGDFVPRGELMQNQTTPIVRIDQAGRPRASLAPAGALAA
jgi:hypothetical protein